MEYELRLLEQMAAGHAGGNPGKEATRIREQFISVSLSHKKPNYLQRYFRVHREGLQGLMKLLQAQTLTKRKIVLLTTIEGLSAWMDDHLSQYLVVDTGVAEGDIDIDAQRLNTTFNLQELGVILRLYIEAGVIRVRNRKAMTRFMSKYISIRTRQVPERFSEDHLYNAIHSPSIVAMDRIQKVLNALLAELSKLRREEKKKKK